MNPNAQAFDDARKAKAFILAGNAKVTLESLRTGSHLTYKIRISPDGNVWFVYRRSRRKGYAYLGMITGDRGFTATRATRTIDRESPHYSAFVWFWPILCSGRLPETAQLWHEGRCGMCGGDLTKPESIQRGYGPICWKQTDEYLLSIEIADQERDSARRSAPRQDDYRDGTDSMHSAESGSGEPSHSLSE